MSDNIREMMHSGHPQNQAIAAAYANARKYGAHFAGGGAVQVSNYIRRPPQSGLIHSAVPGRTDRIPMSVNSGSYVLPADVVSGLGENNSMAGGAALDKLLGQRPYGGKQPHFATPKVNYGHISPMPRPHRMFRPPSVPGTNMSTSPIRQKFAEGGHGKTDIIAAGGEYLIHPETVRAIGGGDIEKGFEILDAFVKHVRAQNVKKLKKLPGPKK